VHSKPRGVIAYLLLAFGLTWISLAVTWLLGLHSPDDNAPLSSYILFTVLTLPVSFGPAIATFVVRQWITREGFADAGLKLNLRRTWQYYVFAWLYPLAAAPVVVVLAIIVGFAAPGVAKLSLMDVAGPLLISLVSTLVTFGEEFGWRGYLQIRLFADRPLLAAIATGLIWGIWHYPMILLGYLFPGQATMALVLYPVNMVVTSVLYGWLRLRTGSVWSASLFHAAGNSLLTSLLQSLFGDAYSIIVWGTLRLPVLAALAIWVILSGQLHQSQPATHLSRSQH